MRVPPYHLTVGICLPEIMNLKYKVIMVLIRNRILHTHLNTILNDLIHYQISFLTNNFPVFLKE
jgi:hypothetical protein